MLPIQSVAVIGAGTMGAGIAQWMVQQMLPTFLCDSNPQQLELAQEQIHRSWDKLVERGKITAAQASQMKSLLATASLNSVATETSLVIEAVVENLKVKQELFSKLAGHFAADSILATNTSSFPIAEIAATLHPEQRRRVVGLHFFNPAPIMQLVEVIQGPESDPTLCLGLYQWFESQGKKPALCGDSPGFIVNRVARSFYGEPLRILATEDEQRARQIDQIFKSVGDFKMGPFELMDLIGVEVNLSVTTSVWEAMRCSPRFAPHALQERLVQAGRFGRKTRHGFYHYE